MCAFSANKNTTKREIMDLDLFGKIARQIFPSTRYLYLSCGSEPLVTPHFEEYLKVARHYRVPFISFCTNGTLLNESLIKEIVGLSINEVIFSIDGAKKETFERIRKGADFEKVLDGIRELNKGKAANKSQFPVIRFNCTMQKDNFEELEDIVRLAKDLNVATVQLRHMVSQDLNLIEKSLYGSKEEYNKKIDKISKLAKQLKIQVLYPPKFRILAKDPGGEEVNECAFPWFHLNIDHRGQAKPCPFIRSHIIDLGSNTYGDYLKSAKLANIKKELSSNGQNSCVRYCRSQGGVVDINSEYYFK
jgi:MoaA/NifB/PqqE/SkfB family radical SAM enzyme